MTDSGHPVDREHACAVSGCSNSATQSRDRLIRETSTDNLRQVTWDVCDRHGAEFDGDPDAFARRMVNA